MNHALGVGGLTSFARLWGLSPAELLLAGTSEHMNEHHIASNDNGVKPTEGSCGLNELMHVIHI